jgi:programmed cell death protein 5
MDSDLAALRHQAAAGGGGGGSAGAPQQARAEAEAKEAQRKQMLDAILAPDAKERLARIRLVKPDKAFGVENLLLNAAQSGRLKNQVDEATLVDMLRQVSEQQEKAKKVTITRKKDPFDDDDDDDLFDMS